MRCWTTGYTQSELDEAQDRYALRFPPDLIDLLLERQPEGGYDWSTENDNIRRMINWPLECLLFDVEHGLWWPDWGDMPNLMKDRADIVRAAIQSAPRLIPLLSHRFIPETPHETGNPVFSMYGFDTICYGADLEQYFRNEFEGRHEIGSARHIFFWSDIVDRHQDAYPA